MDAAAAAAMSDPERNPHFRRRWGEGAACVSADPSRAAIGTLGLALQEALARRRRAELADVLPSYDSDVPR